MEQTELVYVADPMCSWCYGFGPELDKVHAELQPVPIRLVMGGLWVGNQAQPLTDQLKAYLREAWTNVHRHSGQPFNHGLLDWEDWVYDTEPACRAVVTMRQLAPSAAARFFTALQYAFYAENRDLTDDFTYPGLLEGFPVEIDHFMLTMRSAETVEATRADFAEARRIGALGFPTLLLRQGTSYTPLARGFKRAADIIRTFRVLAA